MDFPHWLDKMLRQRGWSRAELARRSGLSPSTLSMISSGQRRVGLEACRAFARALQLPEAEVLRAAGLLQPDPDSKRSDPVMEELLYLAARLPADDRQDLIDLARAKVERRERVKKPARKAPAP